MGMGIKDFSSSECVRALVQLGFVLKKVRRGPHLKYEPPKDILEKIPSDSPHFIMVPKHRVIHCQEEIVKELKSMGGEELAKQFENYL